MKASMAARFFAAIAILALIAISPASSAGATALRFKAREHNFGLITGVEKRIHDFSFTNTAKKSVRILSVTPSCGCTAAKPEKTEYKPGEAGRIRAKFNPAGQTGHHESTVIVEDDSGGKYVLTLAADIKTDAPATQKINLPDPAISVAPRKVDLGAFEEGETVFFKVIVKNNGDGDLYLWGNNSQNEAGVRLSEKAIKKGKKIELTLFYKPEKAGKIDDFAVIRSNDPKNPELKIHLSGKALKASKAKKAAKRNNHE